MIKKILPLLTALSLCACASSCAAASDDPPPTDSSHHQASAPITENISVPDAETTPSDTALSADLTAEDGARSACQAVSVCLFDSDVQGDDPAVRKALSESFPAACSDNGLDLGAKRPADKGDRLIYDTMRRAGYSAGTVNVDVGAEDGYTVRCTLPDGSSAEYPQKERKD